MFSDRIFFIKKPLKLTWLSVVDSNILTCWLVCKGRLVRAKARVDGGSEVQEDDQHHLLLQIFNQNIDKICYMVYA